jgi:ribonuclease P protein component
VAYAVSRAVGPAVVRNKVRRRLRALVTQVGADLAPGAYLITASPQAARSSYSELRSSLCTALGALHAPRPGRSS